MTTKNFLIPFDTKRCKPCEGTTPAFSLDEARDGLKQLQGWQLDEKQKAILKEFTMKNFLAAVDFIRQIAIIAETEGHHPDLHLTGYRHLRIELTTHAIGGLSENDFILAAKIENLPYQLKS